VKNLKKVVLVGAKGDCSARFYLPKLHDLASRGLIDLTLADFGEWPWNTPNGAVYLDLNTVEGERAYKELGGIHVVFVVTWDRSHSKVVAEWLNRAEVVFVEKPLDVSLENVELYLSNTVLANTRTKVFGYDHYLAKFYAFVLDRAEHLGKIGGLLKADFRLLETIEIPTERASALSRGLIPDLFSHFPAIMVGIFGEENQTEITRVVTAVYEDSPISAPTFALVEMAYPIEARVVVGKAVAEIDKSLRLFGQNGEISFNIGEYTFEVKNRDGETTHHGEMTRDFSERFIEGAIWGDPEVAPGVMSFASAKHVLSLIEEAEAVAEPSGIYPKGVTLTEILAI